jgi:hypothetical protein
MEMALMQVAAIFNEIYVRQFTGEFDCFGFHTPD